MSPRCKVPLLLTLAILLGLPACAGRQPQVKVIGISQPSRRAAPESLVVFLEVVNPTRRDFQLSRIEYQLAAESWFATKGAVNLSRAISADSVAVVEIAIPVEGGRRSGHEAKVPYRFEGRLFTVEERVERSWRVKVNGTIGTAPLGVAGPRIFGTVATAE